MSRPHFVGGALLAACAAGPFLTAPLLLYAGYHSYGPAGVSAGVIAMLGATILTIPFGFVVALLPSVCCAAALALLGRDRYWVRHPLVWAASGFSIGTVVGLCFLNLGNSDSPWNAVLAGASIFGIAGAPCALLARWRTKWIDAAVSYNVASG